MSSRALLLGSPPKNRTEQNGLSSFAAFLPMDSLMITQASGFPRVENVSGFGAQRCGIWLIPREFLSDRQQHFQPGNRCNSRSEELFDVSISFGRADFGQAITIIIRSAFLSALNNGVGQQQECRCFLLHSWIPIDHFDLDDILILAGCATIGPWRSDNCFINLVYLEVNSESKACIVIGGLDVCWTGDSDDT